MTAQERERIVFGYGFIAGVLALLCLIAVLVGANTLGGPMQLAAILIPIAIAAFFAWGICRMAARADKKARRIWKDRG